MIDEIIMGYNCTIFAYGQTGSGKTFTMTGERSDKLRYTWESDPLAGIIPRALSQLFETLQSNGADFSVRVSFLEVYNEELFDLLSVTDDAVRLMIYDDVNRKGSVIIKGLREVMVLDKDDVYGVIERGLARRQTAATLLNAQSSRSHSIFTVTVHIKEVNPLTDDELLRIGKLHLVDLAGSENVGRSGAIDKRAREAGSINQSLLTLGRVITALVEHAPHIPYRESKLTRLLQDSLGGHTKTSIIATISPAMTSLEETLSTLDYAHRAKNIENRPEINARLNKTVLVRGFNEELERLRRDLEAARTKNGIFVNEDNYKALQSQLADQRSRIDALEEKKETLLEQINEAQELYIVTQEELNETRMLKEKVENELIAYQKDLETLRARFLKLKQRYEETDYLREEHKKTESLLHEKATSLLSTADTAVSDVNGLHQKVARLTVLDKENLERLNTLPNNWLPERLKPSMSDISALAFKMESFCYFVRDSTNNLREKLVQSACETVKVQREMIQKLRTFLANECTDDARQLKEFSDKQATEAKTCLETIIVPKFTALQELLTSLTNSADDLDRNFATQLAAYRESDLKLQSTIEELDQFASLSASFVLSEAKHDKEIQNQMDYCKMQHNKLLKELESMMDKVKMLTAKHDSISEQLSLRSSRLTEFSRSNQSKVEEMKSSLFTTQQSILDDVCMAHNSNKLSVNHLKDIMHTVSHNHDELKEDVGSCLDNICKSAEQFACNGLGENLVKRASIWQMQNQENIDGHAFGLTKDMESSVHNDVFNPLQDHTNVLLGLEAAGSEFGNEFTQGVETVQKDLSNIPGEMEEILKGNYHIYVPTGETPQFRRFSYPKEFPKTASYRRILKEYRLNRNLQDTDDLASIPLPGEDFSFTTDFNESTFIEEPVSSFKPESTSGGDNDAVSVSTNGLDSGITSVAGDVETKKSAQQQITSGVERKPKSGKCKKNLKVSDKKQHFKP
ncbi:unnamed protein product [Trichobilharzia szidati]|nr:unnamed protein product [Trichobilharzia szidati]